jgi:hypothetical protein
MHSFPWAVDDNRLNRKIYEEKTQATIDPIHLLIESYFWKFDRVGFHLTLQIDAKMARIDQIEFLYFILSYDRYLLCGSCKSSSILFS